MVSETQTDDVEAKSSGSRRPRDREQTESRLVQAAIEMLSADGVLGGLNLRDVATNAGVARTSIYNFFGDRRQLLRKALAIKVAVLDDYNGISPLPFVDRKVRLIGDKDNALHGQLISLLVIDGDEEILPMPFFEAAMRRMQDDVDSGHIHEDHAQDLEALHIVIHAATRGYNLLRTAYARQAGIAVDELDARIRTVFEAGLQQLSEPRAATNDRESK